MYINSSLVILSALIAVIATIPVAGNAQNKNLPGHKLAAIWCSACHNTEGVGSNGKEAPSFPELSARPYLNQQFVTDWISGNNHPAMPKFKIRSNIGRRSPPIS